MNLHQDFRLWLTTESHSKFPATLLESCLKVTYESPPGIKRNLQRTLNSWSPSVFESSDNVSKVLYFFRENRLQLINVKTLNIVIRLKQFLFWLGSMLLYKNVEYLFLKDGVNFMNFLTVI